MSDKTRTIFKKNSKSFFFAGIFLNDQTFKNSSILYEFCRYIDDLADKKNKDKKIRVKKVMDNVIEGKGNLKIKKILSLINNKTINKIHLLQLIEGIRYDLRKKVRIKSDKELISYAYLVAGTVGLMMSDILKVKNKVAKKYALDLGIAFQLTNIARDILEDANINRIYFPENWYKLKANDVTNPDSKKKRVLITLTKRILIMAEKYYKSSLKGLAFLGLKNRFAIFLALIIYRQIGLKIIKKGFSNLNKREKVSLMGKFFCLLKCIILFSINIKIHTKNYNHDDKLHYYIRDIVIID